MKQAYLVPLIVALTAYAAEVQALGSHPPPNGYVPDAKTAVRIAVAVWSPIYGEEKIQSEKPFRVSLKGDIWTVRGSLHPLPGLIVTGGTALAQISKKDGCVLYVMHGK